MEFDVAAQREPPGLGIDILPRCDDPRINATLSVGHGEQIENVTLPRVGGRFAAHDWIECRGAALPGDDQALIGTVSRRGLRACQRRQHGADCSGRSQSLLDERHSQSSLRLFLDGYAPRKRHYRTDLNLWQWGRKQREFGVS